MATKKKSASKAGAKQHELPQTAAVELTPSGAASEESAVLPTKPDDLQSVSGDAEALREAASDSLQSPTALANPVEALSVLDAAETQRQQAQSPVESVPAGGASDAAASLTEAAAMNAAVADPMPKRKGGWPKGKPRRPSSASSAEFPARSPGASGSAVSSLSEAQLRARLQAAEAQLDERAKVGLAVGFTQLAKVGFGFAARRQGTHWYLQDDEAKEIGEAFATAAAPYMSYIAPAIPLLVAGGSLYSAIALRLEVEQEIVQGKRQRVLPGSENAA